MRFEVQQLAAMLALGLGVYAWPWASQRLGCLGSVLFIVPCWVSVTLAATELARYKRQLFISQYLSGEGRLARLLRPGPLLFAWQVSKALFLTLVLIVSTLTLGVETRLLLLADLLVLPVLLYASGALLRGEIREDIRAPLARHWAHWINTILLWLGLTVVLVFTATTDYRSLPWQDVVRLGAAQTSVSCDALGVLARFHAVGEALALWSAQNLFVGLERPRQVLLAWVVFSAAFGVSFLMAWAYSRILVGVWARPWRIPMMSPRRGHDLG